jgi:hypothetical protein
MVQEKQKGSSEECPAQQQIGTIFLAKSQKDNIYYEIYDHSFEVSLIVIPSEGILTFVGANNRTDQLNRADPQHVEHKNYDKFFHGFVVWF